jgi:hypothetical protein
MSDSNYTNDDEQHNHSQVGVPLHRGFRRTTERSSDPRATRGRHTATSDGGCITGFRCPGYILWDNHRGEIARFILTLIQDSSHRREKRAIGVVVKALTTNQLLSQGHTSMLQRRGGIRNNIRQLSRWLAKRRKSRNSRESWCCCSHAF